MRERWFIAEGTQRKGPFSFEQLLEAVQSTAIPGAALIWRKGFEDWTRADTVAQLADRLAPPKPREERPATGPRDGAAPAFAAAAPPAARTHGARQTPTVAASSAAVLVTLWVAWLLRPPPPGSPVPLGARGQDDSPAVVVPPAPPTTPHTSVGPGSPVRETPSTPAAGQVSDDETALPVAELHKLRGVAAWSPETLRLTVYNGTAWRVTGLRLKIERFTGEAFVEDPQPLLLLPPNTPVDQNVADLLARVAPRRKKPGLNALDTGAFEAKAGAAPEGFRWEIESARGYAPQR